MVGNEVRPGHVVPWRPEGHDFILYKMGSQEWIWGQFNANIIWHIYVYTKGL